MANWTREGFLGKMFKVFKAHLPPPPVGVPSPMMKAFWAFDKAAVAGGAIPVKYSKFAFQNGIHLSKND